MPFGFVVVAIHRRRPSSFDPGYHLYYQLRSCCSRFYARLAILEQEGLTNRGSQRPRYEISSACLPRHPAVAYLFPVRRSSRIEAASRESENSMSAHHEGIVADGSERYREARDYAGIRRRVFDEVSKRFESEKAISPFWRRCWIEVKIRREVYSRMRHEFPPGCLYISSSQPEPPNKALQPTPTSVTDRAAARSAPAMGVADL